MCRTRLELKWTDYAASFPITQFVVESENVAIKNKKGQRLMAEFSISVKKIHKRLY